MSAKIMAAVILSGLLQIVAVELAIGQEAAPEARPPVIAAAPVAQKHLESRPPVVKKVSRQKQKKSSGQPAEQIN